MAVVGFAFFGPGAIRPFDGAQIWGGPTQGVRRLSWRIAVIQRMRGIDSTRNIGAIVVQAAADSGGGGARCRTNADGTCEVEIQLNGEAHGNVHASIATETDAYPLAAGDFAREQGPWGERPGHPSRINGRSKGELAVTVYARRGIFAAPFRDELAVEVERNGAPVRGARVKVGAETADLDGTTSDTRKTTTLSDQYGIARIGLAPRTHTLEVDIEAVAAGLTGTWSGVLPVVPGAIWLDPARLAERKIRIVAPVPRELAYATLATSSARVWGGVIPLFADPQGFATGEIDWPEGELLGRVPLWLTLASDPRASGAGTVGWPLPTSGDPVAQDERPFRDWLLLDGMPAAELRDADRRRRARGLAMIALFAAAVLEGVFLAESSDRKGARSWVGLLVAIATVALAFAVLGVVVMWKTSG
jgi:hypothetical protein